uniref:Kunitz/Bovine pancreatic trypsin inhibitor domain protein n=1 Tax=Syphacia muris TaxID=451379 RepID=A0A0N5AGB2_9BILA
MVAEDVDPCKRQPFRGRCPGVNGGPQTRSQFVLRYYVRDNECVSYPFGHCARDENEPKLYRYKEECEEACLRRKKISNSIQSVTTNSTTVKTDDLFTTSRTVLSKATSTHSPALTQKTECERRRDLGKDKNGFVPLCSPNGEYQALQCKNNGQTCFCMDSKGVEIAHSRTNGRKKPDCQRIMESRQPTTPDCSMHPEPGPCTSSLTRWYYDRNQKSCLQFKYFGCGGNGNNYETKAACERHCATNTELLQCQMGKKPLRNGDGELINCAKVACPSGYKCSSIQQQSVCCPDVEKFRETGSSHSPVDPKVCGLTKERGPCDKYELRFYYNNDLKECKYFFYGGCEGNGNNFEKVEDCERTCVQMAKTSRISNNQASTAAPQVTTPTTTHKKKLIPFTAAHHTPTPTMSPVGRGSKHEMKTVTESPETLLPVNRCKHPRDPGDCNGQFIRWYWNQKLKICETFTYTGCKGNGNNFASKEDCLGNCRIDESEIMDLSNVCDHEIDSGECKQAFQRYAFDKSTGNCRVFVYSGCGGNGNNFGSLEECRRKCAKTAGVTTPTSERRFTNRYSTTQRDPLTTVSSVTPSITSTRSSNRVVTTTTSPESVTVNYNTETAHKNIKEKEKTNRPSHQLGSNINGQTLGDKCTQPMDSGPCTNFVTRYFYNANTGACEAFKYGGCAGNKNHFFSRKECEIHCARFSKKPINKIGSEKTVTATSTTISTTALPVEQPKSAPAPTLELEPEFVQTIEGQISVPNKIPLNEEPNTNDKTTTVNRYQIESVSQVTQPATQVTQLSAFSDTTLKTTRIDNTAEVATPSSINANDLDEAQNSEFSTTIEADISDEKLHKTTESISEADNENVIPNIATSKSQENVPSLKKSEQENEFAEKASSKQQHQKNPQQLEKEIRQQEVENKQRQESMKPKEVQQQRRPPPAVEPSERSETAQDRNVDQSQQILLADICAQPPDPGNCYKYVPRWFYNLQTGRCEQFSYGSCGGNLNNFLDRDTCEMRCQTTNTLNEAQIPPRCAQPKDEGTGNGYNVRWYFNTRNLRCEQMVYRGNDGNDNQFSTLGSCQQACILDNNKKPNEQPSPPPSQEPVQRSRVYESPNSPFHHISPVTPPQKIMPPEVPLPPTAPVFSPDASAVKEISNIDDSTDAEPKIIKPANLDENSFREVPLPPSSSNAEIFSSSKDVVRSENEKPFELPSSLKPTPDVFRSPPCANGERPLLQNDGHPMYCLPGKRQCPKNSECFFNGINFFCCPKAEDPYDKHVFGGYNGDEEKNGYKSIRNDLNIQLIDDNLKRSKRQEANYFDEKVLPTRIDGTLPGKYYQATSISQHFKSNPCVQPVDPGPCKEAHLRYFFDKKTKSCRLFYYGGCEGNTNNFDTELECEHRCNGEARTEFASSELCPDGRMPLGENAPVLCGNITDSIGCPIGYYCNHGPPEVCCPDDSLNTLDLQRILTESKKSENVRFSPANVKRSSRIEIDDEPDKAKRESTKSLDSFLSTICPDGSDALTDNATGKIIKCGTEKDGEAFCPLGYYCSINNEKGWRMCCSLSPSGNNIPPPPVTPPYFGNRRANPGEVIERGSLPSDMKANSPLSFYLNNPEKQKPEISDTESFMNAFNGDEGNTNERFSETTEGKKDVDNSEYGRMVMRPDGKLQHETSGSDTDGVQINIGSTEDPFDIANGAKKNRSNRSICMLDSLEGRACREDEPMPRTNLQYAYSRKDKRCKLFFYKGCGGNDNRFETKKQCEAKCMGI